MEADGVKEVGISNLKDAVKAVYKVATSLLLELVFIDSILLAPISEKIENMYSRYGND